MPVVYYEGQRIYFRPLEPGDEPKLRTWINDPRVWATLGFRLPINECREMEFIQNFGKDEKNVIFGIVARDGDQLIGTCGMHGISPFAHKATYGLMIGDVEQHGNGYGSEATRLAVKFAFDELNLNRLQLDVFAHNAPAIRVYEKAGFVLEGCRRQAGYRGGRYHDVLMYAILREEYDAMNAREASREPAAAGA